jgi:hypothetical protein
LAVVLEVLTASDRTIIALKMEAVNPSETSVSLSQITGGIIPEDSQLLTRRHENVKSCGGLFYM